MALGETMFRVAVIQNGIEMQHSGYVDAIQRYRKFARIGREKADFTRFSGVNIRDLFSQGSNYLMDFHFHGFSPNFLFLNETCIA